MHTRQSLIGSVGAWSLAFSPAPAKPLSASEEIARLERQTELLRKEFKALLSGYRSSIDAALRTARDATFFADNTLCVTEVATGCVVETASRKISVGYGMGGSFLVPRGPAELESSI